MATVLEMPFPHRAAAIVRHADALLDQSARLLARALSSRCPGGIGEVAALHGDGVSSLTSAPVSQGTGVLSGGTV